MHAQDHRNPFAGNALPPTRGSRLELGERQKVSWRGVGSVSRSSMVHSQFPGQSLVDDSCLAILAKTRCKRIERFIGVTCTMAMNGGNNVSLSSVSTVWTVAILLEPEQEVDSCCVIVWCIAKRSFLL